VYGITVTTQYEAGNATGNSTRQITGIGTFYDLFDSAFKTH